MPSSLVRLLFRTYSCAPLSPWWAAAATATALPPVPALAGLRHLSRTTLRTNLSWEGRGAAAPVSSSSSEAKCLLSRLEGALRARRVDEAWVAFDALQASGDLFPNQALVGGLITASSYCTDTHRLCQAYDLAVALSRKRAELLHYDSLARLALALARGQMPEPAATVLRIMLESGKLPPASIWGSAIFHLVKTPVGSHVASGILIELCEYFMRCPFNSKRSKLTKPCTTLFNIVLDSCLRCGSPLKAQQLIDVMPKTGVVADVNSIIAIARVYEMNGHRDDLKRLKLHVDSVPLVLLDRYYQQFYDCLLSLHFKFNDLGAAAKLVLDLYQRPNMITKQIALGKPQLVQVGSGNLKTGCRMLVEPTLLGCDILIEPEGHFDYVRLINGMLRPSHKTIAKLINGFVRLKRVGELSKLLVSIHNVVRPSVEPNLHSEVIAACAEVGWLETAHDILDDMESAGVTVPEVTYALLLTAYCKQNLLSEARVLLRQMSKGGVLENLSDEEAISLCLSDKLPAHHIDSKGANSVNVTYLAKFLDTAAREDESRDHLIYEFNSSILFFCKAKMMEDAIKTFRRMHERKVPPTLQTFSHLINGYSSLEMYREITILWGEIRSRLEVGVLPADRDLFECLLWNFIRGGYFERVMEVVSYLAKYDMHADKWKFKREFLKLHKDLYRNLNTSNARTDAQSKRLVHVKAFRKWVGIDRVKGSN